MTLFLQGCCAVLLAVVLIQAQGKNGKDIGTLLAIGVCCMCGILAMRYLEPVINFLDQLESLGGINSSMLQILLKVVGIGIVSEVAALVCTDAGNASMGKTLQLLGTGTILWLSLPLFSALIELLQDILGEL